MKKWILIFTAALLLTGCAKKQEANLDRTELRKKAFEHAGVQEANAYDLDEDFDYEGGTTYYELDFEVNGIEYEYTLNAQTGKIIHYSSDVPPIAQTDPIIVPVSQNTEPSVTTEPQIINEEEAIQIALEHAGLTRGAVKSLSVEYDPSEGTYEVDFFVKGMDYEYEINAYTGAILEADKDRD